MCVCVRTCVCVCARFIRVQVQCWFTSIETIRTVRDREPRTATVTFTQLLPELCSSEDKPLKKKIF